ncbi:MAG: hypothetical protein IAE82_20240, partial [Opitutaceae bacterium]|nr:hypothetical protein [Opitutaceae bacterium]
RESLALEQAKFQSGLSEAIRVGEAQAEVDFIAAEMAGATDRDLIAIRLGLARDRLALIEARAKAGLVDTGEVDDLRDEVAVLVALLGDDIPAPFHILMDQERRRYRLVEARHSAGLATAAERNAAKERLDLAIVRFRRVQAPDMGGPERTGGDAP